MGTRKQPIQPLVRINDILRFQENSIVRHLLDHSTTKGFGLNELSMMNFPQADWEQFAQLIGYTLSGFSELSYASDETYEAAQLTAEGRTESEARIESLTAMLDKARAAVREAAVALFRIHPDDLHS